MQFDLVTLVNTCLGALLGGLISVPISYYFFARGKGLNILSHWMANNLGEIFIRQSYPQFFGSLGARCIPIETPPSDGDVPRLGEVIISPPIGKPGRSFEILCRVDDEEWNFPMSAGLSVCFQQQMQTFKNAEFGYMYACIPIPGSQPKGSYTLEFTMRDAPSGNRSPNIFSQSIKITIA